VAPREAVEPTPVLMGASTPDGDGAPWTRDGLSPIAARGQRARDNVVSALHELGELAPLVRQLDDGEELLEVLEYVDSLRVGLADSSDILQGVVRAGEELDSAP
jgi:hypothetical protein